MIRELIADRRIGRGATFRWRGTEVSRIEGFSDGVFAFALTLLVVSLDVPDTFDQLARAMLNFASFAICFMLLIIVWYEHYIFFRRYGLEDPLTVALNALLLFVVLFYIYPLKFLFTRLVDLVLGIDAVVPGPDGSLMPPLTDAQWPGLLMIYAAGYVACFLFFLLLYLNAWNRRFRLALTPLELLETRASINSHVAHIVVGTISFLIAARGFTLWAGLSFWLLYPVLWLHGRIINRRRTVLEQQTNTIGAATPVAGAEN